MGPQPAGDGRIEMVVEASTGRRERKRQQTSESLRQHAQTLFRQNGYAATTVAQIAEAADVSEPTFFRHFGSKSDVALAPLTDGISAAIDAVMTRTWPLVKPLPVFACMVAMTYYSPEVKAGCALLAMRKQDTRTDGATHRLTWTTAGSRHSATPLHRDHTPLVVGLKQTRPKYY